MLRTSFNGSPFLGVFGVTTDESLLITPELRDTEPLEGELEVSRVYSGTINEASVLGSMAVGNSSGIAVSSSALDSEVERLREVCGVRVERVPGRINAVGNVVLANDSAAVASPELSGDAAQDIADILEVEIERTTIGGLNIVGSAAVATNNGVLVHPRTTDGELESLEEAFDLHVDVGTVNYGTPLVGSGLLANSHGYVAGGETTGPELGRIEETLGFVDL